MPCKTNNNGHLPYIEPTIRTIIGFLVTVLGALLYFVPQESALWLGLLLFISINVLQSGFTRFCIMELILKRMGLRCELDEIRQLSSQLQQSATRQAGYMDTLNLLSEAVLELSPEGRILSASEGWRRLLDAGGGAAATCADSLLDCVAAEDRDRVAQMLESIAGNADRILRIRFRLDGDHKKEYWVGGRFMLDRHDNENIRIKGVLRDITESYQQERQIQHMAMHDALTGLPNRALLENRIGQALAQARRQGFHVGVLFIDLDNFKQVNDTHGHKSGDRLLCRIGRVLANCLRASDTLARWGGDEFVALLPDLHHPVENMRTVARNLMMALEEELRGDDSCGDGVTLSIGGACYPDNADHADALLAQADKALYFAKSQGRNNVQIYSDIQKNSRAFGEFDIGARLGEAVRAGQIQTRYQVIVDAGSRQPVGVEALARWYDPQRGWISPACFISLAENLGLIQELSHQVVDRAISDFARLLEARPDLFLSLNVSTRQLHDQTFATRLRALLGERDMAPSQVKLEITESLSLLEIASARKLLDELRVSGFRLALDDFGTGFSSLSKLHELPFDELKIDMSFVRRANERSGRIMLDTIIRMGHELGFRIVAEGVERADHAHILQELGCDFLQGYHFGRPQPLDSCLRALQQEPARVQPVVVLPVTS